MSNIKQYRLIADVPFSWLQDDMPSEDAAAVASLLLSPSTNCEFEYEDRGYVPNENGGHTSMYRILIEGEEALSYPFLERLAEILAKAGTLHVAEARDTQWEGENNPWEHICDTSLLSGQAEARR